MPSIEQYLLQLSADGKKTALEMIQKSEKGSRSEMVNQMLHCCAEMLEWKLKNVPLGPA
jgi:hypothetical protein